MTESSIDVKIIRQTQNTLGKFVKKPNLSEKLLSKPPFRFLFDVFCVVIRDTGVFQGLYTTEELTYSNIKNREDKMQFLQKIIDVVELTTKRSLGLRTSKIVAGHQADRTNKLLQDVSDIIEKQMDWKSSVEKVLLQKNQKQDHLETGKSRKPSKKAVDASSVTRKSERDKKVNKTLSSGQKIQKEETKKNRKESTEDIGNTNKSTVPLETKTASILKGNLGKSEENHNAAIEVKKPEEVEKRIHQKDTASSNDSHKSVKSLESPVEANSTKRLEATVVEQNVIPKEQQHSKLPEVENDYLDAGSDSIAIQQLSTQENLKLDKTPSNSTHIVKSSVDEKQHEATDKIKSNETNNKKTTENLTSEDTSNDFKVKRETTFTREVTLDEQTKAERPQTSLRPPSVRPPSARPGAPRRRDRNVEIILEPNQSIKAAGVDIKLEPFTDLEDGESFVIVANNSGNEVDSSEATDYAAASMVVGEQGHLVQQILETQKQLVQPTEEAKFTKLETKKRQSNNQHVSNVSEIIQTLTKCVNPMGKLFEFIPEDMDAMHLEYRMWNEQCIQASSNLRKEQSRTDAIIEPLKNQLNDLDGHINEYSEMIDATRLRILQNRDKLFSLCSAN